VTHHGNGEQPFALQGRAKNFLNRALLTDAPPPPATVVLLRAAYHDGPLKDYTRAAGDLAGGWRSWPPPSSAHGPCSTLRA
jgi:hypothetical protein